MPTSAPVPQTRFITPGGNPASSKTATRLRAESGVSVAGLKTTVLPAMSAAIIFQLGIATGKFHGVTQATTPTGSRTAIADLFGNSAGTTVPKRRRPSPAM